jgi:hypothetical protein
MKLLRLLLLISSALFATGCDRPLDLPDCLTEEAGFKPDDCPVHGDCNFRFYPESRIEVTEDENYTSVEIKEGDYLVFHFQYTRRDNPQIFDDEYSESVYFQVIPDGDTFLITEQELTQASAVFGRFCFCPDGGYHRITRGCIYGKKTSDKTWNISFRLTASSDNNEYERMKQHCFSRAKREE